MNRIYTIEKKIYKISELNKIIERHGEKIHLLTRNEDLKECYSEYLSSHPGSNIDINDFNERYYISIMSSKNGRYDIPDKKIVGNILNLKIKKWEWDESGEKIILYTLKSNKS